MRGRTVKCAKNEYTRMCRLYLRANFLGSIGIGTMYEQSTSVESFRKGVFLTSRKLTRFLLMLIGLETGGRGEKVDLEGRCFRGLSGIILLRKTHSCYIFFMFIYLCNIVIYLCQSFSL